MLKALKEKKIIHQGFDNFLFFPEMVVKYFCLKFWFLFVLLVFVFLFVAFNYLRNIL